MRTIICKYGNGGNVSLLADSAKGTLPKLPALDRHGMTMRGHSAGYYLITDVPADMSVSEVVKRAGHTMIWGVWQMPLSSLDDGRGDHCRIVTPKTLAAA